MTRGRVAIQHPGAADEASSSAAGVVEPAMSGLAHPPPSPITLATTDRRVRDVLPSVVRAVPMGVAIVRRDRSLAYHNDTFARILGLDDAPGPERVAPLLRADGTAFGPGDDPLDRLLRRGESLAGREAILGRADGTQITASVSASPVVGAGGDVVGALLYVDDVRDADDRSLREAFVGVLSHELRTPITAIYGGSQLLLSDRLPPDIRTSVVRDIAAEAEQLQRLVEDLLVIARVERGVTESAAEPMLLQRLAREAAAAEERRWAGRPIEVLADPGLPAVRGDDGFTLQILRNLISNAVKYSPAGEPVVVTVRATDHAVEVAVLDRGRGFPPGTGPDAFRLFYGSPTVAAHMSGTGIGLYVARALVEAQGGRIWLRDRVGGGSEVGFALPRYDSDDDHG